MNALLITNGEIKDYGYMKRYISNYDAVYCCDGGVRHFEALGISPDVIVGDFDSAEEAAFEKYVNAGAKIFKFPSEKDCTDTELGLRKAIEDGATNITVIGGIGKRFDHSLANAHILAYALEKSVTAKIVDEHNEIVLIDKETTIEGSKGDIISLIPLTTEAACVTVTGVKYPLADRTLKIGSSFSVSNEMVDNTAKISLTSGLLFVMRSWD